MGERRDNTAEQALVTAVQYCLSLLAAEDKEFMLDHPDLNQRAEAENAFTVLQRLVDRWNPKVRGPVYPYLSLTYPEISEFEAITK